MCIFRFNPPAPGGPCKRCRRCLCTPRYWRLEVEAFTSGSSVYPGVYRDSWTVLEFDRFDPLHRLPSSPLYCYWHHRTELAKRTSPGDDFFVAHNHWRLGTYMILSFTDGLGAGVEFNEWVLHGGGPGNVAYTLLPSLGVEAPPHLSRFHCLEPNTFFYWGSEGDPGGEEPPNALGWPTKLTITPYYP